MGRYLVLLCVCCVFYTVTIGQTTEDTSIIPDELDIQRTTGRPSPTGFSDEKLLHVLEDLIDKANAARKPSASTPARPANTPQSLTESINVCGLSSSSLIQGGEAVQDTEFPWLGGLFGRARNMYLCTVNLVSAKHAVTAAHCFPSTNADDFGIRWGLPRASQSGAYTSLFSITVHPGYNTTLHDVAVIELSNSVPFSVFLKPICLWQTTWSPDEGITGTVAGFGPNYQDLKKIKIPIVKQEICRGSHVSFHFITSEFTFCAGTRNPEEGPCKGDSGAGFMQWVKDRYYLRGVVSHSLNADGICNLEEYIVYADLSKEVDWIVEMVFNEATRKPSASTPAQPATTPQSLMESINGCGLPSSSVVQGGEAMQFTKFPWLGALMGLRSFNDVICSVTLVSAKHAVTARHCFDRTNASDYAEDKYFIRWGNPKSNVTSELRSIINHPGNRRLHDVAVVELRDSVTFTLSLKPICLWRTTWSPHKHITGTVSWLDYYGFSEVIKNFEMPIITQEFCRARIGLSQSEFTFCARTENPKPGPCIIESGTGYMQWVKDRYYLRGLKLKRKSYDCDPGDIIIFADLSKEVDWIVEMVFNGATRPPLPSTSARPATTPQSLTESINVCGLANSSVVQAGEAMQGTEFPWLGGLFERTRDVHLCIVNLVSAKHAVTAAHCFVSTNADDFGIRWGLPRASQSGAYTSLFSITVHPGYNRTLFTLHNVAVVELSNSVTFTVSLKPICLWRTTWFPDEDITGTVASFRPNYEDFKDMHIVRKETCRARYGFSPYVTSEFIFCARTNNDKIGFCHDGVGAGFMQWINDRYYLRGLVARRLIEIYCPPEDHIIFADLSKEVDWLVEMIT